VITQTRGQGNLPRHVTCVDILNHISIVKMINVFRFEFRLVHEPGNGKSPQVVSRKLFKVSLRTKKRCSSAIDENYLPKFLVINHGSE